MVAIIGCSNIDTDDDVDDDVADVDDDENDSDAEDYDDDDDGDDDSGVDLVSHATGSRLLRCVGWFSFM